LAFFRTLCSLVAIRCPLDSKNPSSISRVIPETSSLSVQKYTIAAIFIAL